MKVLMICTGNTCRSQMAAAILGSMDVRLQVFSAGVRPGKEVNPHAAMVLGEWGLSLDGQKPRFVGDYVGLDFDYVFTLCENAHQACPPFGGRVGSMVLVPFADPYDATGSLSEILGVYRDVRDALSHWLTDLYGMQLRPVLDHRENGK